LRDKDFEDTVSEMSETYSAIKDAKGKVISNETFESNRE
jgi:hypothetical protein